MQIQAELRKVPLFKGLDEDDLGLLSRRLVVHAVAPGQQIVAKDEPGSSMFVVLAGTVRIFLPPPE